MAKTMTQKHSITYSGFLPADEMERHALFAAHPEILEARRALATALSKAGYPHSVEAKVVRTVVRKPKVAPVELPQADTNF